MSQKFKEIAQLPGKGIYFGVTKTVSGMCNTSIHVEHRRLHLGNFDCPEQAARPYDTAAKKYNKPSYKINFSE